VHVAVALAQAQHHRLGLGHDGEPMHAREVARAAGMAPQDLKLGIDGCSASNDALPLSHLARAYARLASGARDTEFGASFAQLARAMTTIRLRAAT
jgi:L-asparaginase II